MSTAPRDSTVLTNTARALSAPRSRQRTLEPDSVLDTALEIVDREGLGALTIRRLAEDLGVPIATIQVTVGRKENILRGLVERVLSEVDLSSTEADTWAEPLVELLERIHAVFMEHPAVTQLAVLQRITGPKALEVQERILSLLHASGLPETRIVTAYTMIASYLTGFTLLRISRGDFESRAGEPQLDALLRQMPHNDFPMLRALSPSLATQTTAERFRDGLRELLQDLL